MLAYLTHRISKQTAFPFSSVLGIVPITDMITIQFLLVSVHYRLPYQQIEVIGGVVGNCLALGCHGDQTGAFCCVEPDC